ncbi:MAG: glycosyltransferase family 9 protein [Bacteroidota bacterium]
MQETPKKILLGMLVSNGDCLMATVLAKQIKKDFPGCHLTWAISNLCRQVIENNPDIDAIWEVQVSSKLAALKEDWFSFRQLALAKKGAGEFNEVFFTQIYPSNVHQYDGTTRGTIYNAYPFPVTVDARPVIRLKEEEVLRVKDFADKYSLQKYKQVILFECSALSGQSFVTVAWAVEVAEKLADRHENLFIIISTHLQLENPHPGITTASQLTLRENAELTKYCSLLVGCSSGITWMATTDQAKRLPMIQFLRRGIGFKFASVSYDHQFWGLDASNIIETTNSNADKAVDLISSVLKNGIAANRIKYHQKLRPCFLSLVKYSFMFFRRGKFGKSFRVVKNFILRNYIRTKRPG